MNDVRRCAIQREGRDPFAIYQGDCPPGFDRAFHHAVGNVLEAIRHAISAAARAAGVLHHLPLRSHVLHSAGVQEEQHSESAVAAGLGENGGWEWFIKAFNDKNFIDALKNTIILNLLDLVIGTPMPILMALLLN